MALDNTQHDVDCESAEKDQGFCVFAGGPTLSILKEVHNAYEERLEFISRSKSSNKLEKQVEVLQSWVSDLVGQNTLLVQTVEDLESEITSRLTLERRRHAEIVCELRAEASDLRRRLTRRESDLCGVLEVLRRLREFDHFTTIGINFYDINESDIFGSEYCHFKKLEQGDNKRPNAAATERTNIIYK